MVVRTGAWTLASVILAFTPQTVPKAAWPLVHVPDPVANSAIHQALDGAARLVDVPRCRLLLTEFSDASGRPLAERLERLGHLVGELAGGDEHEAARTARLGLGDAGEHRQAEGEGLARPGLGLAAHVSAGQRVGDRQRLDGEGFGDAAGGEVLVTGQTAALAPDLEGVIFESRGRKSLRNVSEPVELFAVFRVGESLGSLPVDPVCRMAVDPEHAPGQLKYAGTAYFFCSLTCAGLFAQNPERFAS